MKTIIAIIAGILMIFGFALYSQEIPTDVKVARDFLVVHEAKIMVKGMHVVYDDKQPTFIKGKFNPKKIMLPGESFAQFKARCVGKPTIGYGCTNPVVVKKMRITDAEAKAQLIIDINAVKVYMPRKFGKAFSKLNTNQRAAVYSYFYNCGKYRKHPKMLAVMKRNHAECWKQMDAGYSNAKAKGVSGLIDRRHAEWKLYKTKVN